MEPSGGADGEQQPGEGWAGYVIASMEPSGGADGEEVQQLAGPLAAQDASTEPSAGADGEEHGLGEMVDDARPFNGAVGRSRR